MSIKNYRDLCLDTQTPRLLVVLELPKDRSQWMTVTGEEPVLRRRAYWFRLRQKNEEVVHQTKVTVYIPKDNLLGVESLQNLMKKSRTGEL